MDMENREGTAPEFSLEFEDFSQFLHSWNELCCIVKITQSSIMLIVMLVVYCMILIIFLY